MSNHVDKIEVTVSGGVSDLAVQGFELTVAVNAIPSVVIDALPIQRSDKGVKASAPKYSDLVQLYDQLSEKTKTLDTKATIKIKIIHQGNKQEEDEITLSDWILTDVGLSTVTTYAAPTLTVVFKHRIVELDHHGVIYEVPKTQHAVDKAFLNIGGSDVISIWDDVYQKFAGSDIKWLKVASIGKGGPKGDYGTKLKQLREQLPQFSPKKYLDCKGGLFLHMCACKKCLKAGIAELVAPQPFGVSTWVTMIQTVCPVTISQVVPTYDKPNLSFEPLEPWQDKTYDIDSEKIEGIDVVSIDPDPIIGVAVKKNFFDHTSAVVSDMTRAEIPENPSNAECALYGIYFPQNLPDLTKVKGRVEFYGENSVITAAKRFDLGAHHSGKLDGQHNTITDKNEEEMIEAVAEAVYEGNYRRNCKAAITAMPMFKDKGGTVIYPGRVLTAKDAESGELCYGYLSRMTVKGSTSGGGMSYFEITAARPKGGKGMYVNEGTTNPCYKQ